MDDREELARLIHSADELSNEGQWGWAYMVKSYPRHIDRYFRLADHILAAGYTRAPERAAEAQED